MPQAQPELKKYVNKRVQIELNGSRRVIANLAGYDVFLNLSLNNAIEERFDGVKVKLGECVLRGNSVVQIQTMERVD